MSDSTINVQRPVPLRELLAVGGNPRHHLGSRWENLLEQIQEVPIQGEEERAHNAEINEYQVECSVRGEPIAFGHTWDDGATVHDPIDDQEYLNYLAWEAEVERDPSLIAVLLEFLDVAERIDYDVRAHHVRAPHPLFVGRIATLRSQRSYPGACSGCGTPFADGDVALAVGWQEGYSDDPEAGEWCFSCVTITYEAMKAAQG